MCHEIIGGNFHGHSQWGLMEMRAGGKSTQTIIASFIVGCPVAKKLKKYHKILKIKPLCGIVKIWGISVILAT